MPSIFRNRAFILGAVISGLLFASANFLTYWNDLESTIEIEKMCGRGVCISKIGAFGFPLPVYYGDFLVVPTALNVVIWIVMSFLTGLLFKYIAAKFSVRGLR